VVKALDCYLGDMHLIPADDDNGDNISSLAPLDDAMSFSAVL